MLGTGTNFSRIKTSEQLSAGTRGHSVSSLGQQLRLCQSARTAARVQNRTVSQGTTGVRICQVLLISVVCPPPGSQVAQAKILPNSTKFECSKPLQHSTPFKYLINSGRKSVYLRHYQLETLRLEMSKRSLQLHEK